VIIHCSSCGKRYKLSGDRFEGRDKLTIRCPNCKELIEVSKDDATAVESTAAGADGPAPTKKIKKPERTFSEGEASTAGLDMPEGKRISLAVLQGPEAGRIIVFDKPLMTIGRANADIVLNDSEISRKHAQIEIKGTAVTLRDLKSTNGTYVNEQRITTSLLENQTEFRVGATTMMLIMTDDEE